MREPIKFICFQENTFLLQKVETKNDDTVAIIYFDDIDDKGLCPIITAFRKHQVSEPKPSSILVYDYYDTCKSNVGKILNTKNNQNFLSF